MLESALLSLLGTLFLSFHVVRAQSVTSNVVCDSDFSWADNSLGQTPCLVAAYLESTCTGGDFSVNTISAGFNYIGPTNSTSSQTECACSSPVYNLISACAACQNRTFITYSTWTTNCPATLTPPEGVFPKAIPSNTTVPHWAYMLPSTTGGIFDPTAAEEIGDTPESSASLAFSTTLTSITSSSATTTVGSGTSSGPAAFSASTTGKSASGPATSTGANSPTNPSGHGNGGGRGGSKSNTGAVVGGVVGGVLGLAAIAAAMVVLSIRSSSRRGAASAKPDVGTGGSDSANGLRSDDATSGGAFPGTSAIADLGPGCGTDSPQLSSSGHATPNPQIFAAEMANYNRQEYMPTPYLGKAPTPAPDAYYNQPFPPDNQLQGQYYTGYQQGAYPSGNAYHQSGYPQLYQQAQYGFVPQMSQVSLHPGYHGMPEV